MKSLPGTSSVHVKTAITPNFCTGTWACWTIRYCSRHSSVRCSALSVTCNSRMHFIEFDSNKFWCKFNTAEWKAWVENPDLHKAISFDCTLPFQSAPSSFLLESNKDQNVWNNDNVLGIVFGDHSMHMGQGSLTILDGQFRLRQHCAVVFQFLHPVDLFGWKDAFNAKVLRGQTKFSVTKWQETIKTLQDMWFTRWPSLQTMTNSPVAGSTIWNTRITLLRLWKNTFGNCVWVRYQSNDAQT